jgi:CRP-like cAMP-binding protein
MKRERKLLFDPKVFLSKVNGGRAISDYRKDQIVYTQGEPADSVFYIQSGKVKKTVVSEQGKEAVVALLGTGDFFGEGCFAAAPGNRLRYDGMRDCANSKGRHHPRDPRRAGVCRAIYRAPLGS